MTISEELPSPDLERASAHETRIITSQRSSLIGDVAAVVAGFVRYRELLYQLTLRDIRLRYKQAIMGFGWALFMPVLVVLAGIIVRFAMAQLAGVELERQAIASVAVRAIPWTFFAGAIGFANTTLVGNHNLVTKIYFPREVLPVAAVLAQGFDSIVGTVALLVAITLFGVDISTAWLWTPLLAAFLFAFTVGLALLLSCANLFYRDVKYIVQVLLTFGIFFTPVFFEASMLGERGAMLMMLNPLAPLLEGLRLAVVDGHNLASSLVVNVREQEILVWTPWYLAYAALSASGCLAIGAVVFHRLEFLFAEYV